MLELLIVPTLLRGEELYTQMVFFCSDNFDRSIYSSYRVVSGIFKQPVQRRIWNKKIFCISFYRASYRGLNFCEYQNNLPYFYSHFPEFSPKISSILLNYIKIFNNSTLDFIQKDKNVLLIILTLFLWPKFG